MKLSIYGAVGEDGFSLQMLVYLPDITKLFILFLFNAIWTSFVFPLAWLSAIDLMFHKPGKDPFIEQDYRPISLISSLCKVMVRQYGFRHVRNTIDDLSQIGTNIKTAFAYKVFTIVVFFDFRKICALYG